MSRSGSLTLSDVRGPMLTITVSRAGGAGAITSSARGEARRRQADRSPGDVGRLREGRCANRADENPPAIRGARVGGANATESPKGATRRKGSLQKRIAVNRRPSPTTSCFTAPNTCYFWPKRLRPSSPGPMLWPARSDREPHSRSTLISRRLDHSVRRPLADAPDSLLGVRQARP
jgi:hypothetical protein